MVNEKDMIGFFERLTDSAKLKVEVVASNIEQARSLSRGFFRATVPFIVAGLGVGLYGAKTYAAEPLPFYNVYANQVQVTDDAQVGRPKSERWGYSLEEILRDDPGSIIIDEDGERYTIEDFILYENHQYLANTLKEKEGATIIDDEGNKIKTGKKSIFDFKPSDMSHAPSFEDLKQKTSDIGSWVNTATGVAQDAMRILGNREGERQASKMNRSARRAHHQARRIERATSGRRSSAQSAREIGNVMRDIGNMIRNHTYTTPRY